jgi:hypothetical protein
MRFSLQKMQASLPSKPFSAFSFCEKIFSAFNFPLTILLLLQASIYCVWIKTPLKYLLLINKCEDGNQDELASNNYKN